jgi:hypothetical protein
MEQASKPVNSMDTTFLLQQPSVENGLSSIENGVTVDAFTRQLLFAMKSFRDGNFSVRLPQDLTGVEGKIADAFNDIVSLAERRAKPRAFHIWSAAKEN